MSEEIVGIRIFAELESGKLRELSMTEDEAILWFEIVARFYQSKFTLSPVDVLVPLLKPKSEK